MVEKQLLAPDDLKRTLSLAQPDSDRNMEHIGLVGDTYTVTVSGEDTAGRFCVIDMHIPPGGGYAHYSASEAQSSGAGGVLEEGYGPGSAVSNGVSEGGLEVLLFSPQ
jgi:hypothetical protein